MGGPLTLKAKYLWRGFGNVVENGAVTIVGSRMTAAGKAAKVGQTGQVIDLGDVVILPGFVNAHTHLELTGLEGQVDGSRGFAAWLSNLVQLTRRMSEDEFVAAAAKGVKRSVRAGTTAICDITRYGSSVDALINSGLRAVVCFEAIALRPENAPREVERISTLLDKLPNHPTVRPGVSAHAPYSNSRELYSACARLADDLDLLLTTHLAESEAEEEFLMEGTGEIEQFLDSLGALYDGWKPPGESGADFLNSMGLLDSPSRLLVHCNFLDDADIDLIRLSGSSVVHCPSSYRFFRHRQDSLRQLLDAGVNVCLGTDSTASGTTLSLLDEIRILAEEDILPLNEIMKMATVNGAIALRLTDVGILEPGWEADVTVVRIPSGARHWFRDGLCSPQAKPILTMVTGQAVWDAIGLA